MLPSISCQSGIQVERTSLSAVWILCALLGYFALAELAFRMVYAQTRNWTELPARGAQTPVCDDAAQPCWAAAT